MSFVAKGGRVVTDTLCYQLSSPIGQDKSKFENLTVFPYMQMIHFAVIIGLPTTRESG